MITNKSSRILFKSIALAVLLAVGLSMLGSCSRITTSDLPPTTVENYEYRSDNCYFTDNKGNDAKFITVAEGQVSTVNSLYFDQNITHNGLSYGVKFTYSKFDNKLVASNSAEDSSNAYFLSIPPEQDIGIFICLNVTKGNFYPLLFDTRNCSVKDILSGTGADELWIESFDASIDFKKMLLVCKDTDGTATATGDDVDISQAKKVYLCDTIEDSLSDMTVLTGIPDLKDAFWADHETIILTRIADPSTSPAKLETWTYDVTTGETSKITDKYYLFDGEAGFGLKLFGTRYALNIEKNGKLRAVDLKDGTSKTISGYTYTEASSIDESTHVRGTLLLMSKKNAKTSTQTAYLIDLRNGVIKKQREIPSEFVNVAYFDENNLIAYSDSSIYSVYPMGND